MKKTAITLEIDKQKESLIVVRNEIKNIDLGNLTNGDQNLINLGIRIQYTINILEQLLTTEREQMIDFAQEYKSHCFQSNVFPDSARTFFNNTYGNGE